MAQKELLFSTAYERPPVTTVLLHPLLTAKFYQLNSYHLFWFTPRIQSLDLRLALKNCIDSAVNAGLSVNKYHYNEIIAVIKNNYTEKDSLEAMVVDKVFTDAAIAICKDIYQGGNIGSLISYDEVSSKYSNVDDEYLLSRLITVQSGDSFLQLMALLEPKEKEYILMKNELKDHFNEKTRFQIQQLANSFNYYRWIHHFRFDKCIVINIASATLRYYEYDSVKLKMKVVVGKPATKTPRFAAYCNQLILYPYWNVPSSIALNELLPKFKRNPSAIDAMNMQVVDGNGKVVNHYKLNWHSYSRYYFPYRFRQSTGCDNSLGVIKFNITSPFSVYMHDTNNKTAFLSASRFYSHGCIRLEQPIELGNLLLNNRLDTTFLQSCYKEQLPVPVDLLKPIPVFVIYSMAEIDSIDRVKYYKDIYGLLK
ncbi:L,D-transpeptidase family protein [Ferruginibacter sp.]